MAVNADPPLRLNDRRCAVRCGTVTDVARNYVSLLLLGEYHQLDGVTALPAKLAAPFTTGAKVGSGTEIWYSVLHR